LHRSEGKGEKGGRKRRKEMEKEKGRNRKRANIKKGSRENTGNKAKRTMPPKFRRVPHVGSLFYMLKCSSVEIII